MKVTELMQRDVRSCRPSDSMERATRVMWEQDCGCVPVVDRADRVLGMITDRDVAMAAYTKGQALGSLRVEQAMSHGAVTCRPEAKLEDVLHTLGKEQVRRLPVVDAGGRLVGLVALADVVQEVSHQGSGPRKQWADEVLATMLELTRPRALPAEPAKAPKAPETPKASKTPKTPAG